MKPLPKYQMIEQDIIDQIREGKLAPGSQLMTENQMCDVYEVSRMTVNKALTSLVNKGYLIRTAGKGTFVLESRVTKSIDPKHASSFSKDIQSIHKKPGAILVEYRVMRAGDLPKLMDRLKLQEDELVHYIHRIRTSNGVRVALSHTYIPCKHLPALDVTVLEGSLYEYLDREYGIHPRAIDYAFNALLPTPKQLELLQAESCALLKSSHRSVIDSGAIFEYTETFYVGYRYTYQFLSSDAPD